VDNPVDDVPGVPAKKPKGGNDKRNTIIAVGTVVLVIIAWYTYKAMTGQSGTAVTGSAGDTGTDGTTEDTSTNGITNLLSETNAELAVDTSLLTKLTKQEKALNAKLKAIRKKIAPTKTAPKKHINPVTGLPRHKVPPKKHAPVSHPKAPPKPKPVHKPTPVHHSSHKPTVAPGAKK
jgi:hypothetical protein